MLLPRAGRRRWPIAAFSISLAAITVVVVALVMRRGADAPAIASHPAESPTVQAAPAQSAQVSPPPGGAPAEPEPGARNEPSVTPPSPSPVPAEPVPAQSVPADPVPGAPAAPVSEDGSAAPAPVEPAVPGRSEPRAPAGSDPPRHTPRPRSTASASREPAPRPQDPGIAIGVAIDSTPPGAQVVLDGAVLGTTPYRGTLTRRDREVKLVVRLAGYNDKWVVARGSQAISRSVTLHKAAPPATKNSKADRDRSVNPFTEVR